MLVKYSFDGGWESGETAALRICSCACVGVFGRGILGGGPLWGGGSKEVCHEETDCTGGEVPLALWEPMVGGGETCAVIG